MIRKVVHLYESHKHKFVISLLSLAVVITVAAGVFIWRDARAKVVSKSSKPKTANTEKSSKDAQAKNGGEPTQTPTPTPTTASQPTPVPSSQKTVSASTYAPAASAPAPVYSSGGAESTISSILFGLINGERARVGVGALTPVGQLQTAAAIRVAEEAITSFAGTDHTRPNGSTFDTVYPEVGYTGYTSWGENLVYGYQSVISTDQSQLYTLANQMFTSWKNSPGHYANMINGSFNQSGIGVKLINQGGYTYYFAIQDFARR